MPLTHAVACADTPPPTPTQPSSNSRSGYDGRSDPKSQLQVVRPGVRPQLALVPGRPTGGDARAGLELLQRGRDAAQQQRRDAARRQSGQLAHAHAAALGA